MARPVQDKAAEPAGLTTEKIQWLMQQRRLSPA
jgi:hypothetical protein